MGSSGGYNMSNNTSDKSDLWGGIGFAIAVLALCAGIGGCTYLEGKALTEVTEAKARLVEAENNSQKVVDTECKCGKIEKE